MAADTGGATAGDEPGPEIAPLFRLERSRLSELLAGLGPADWQRPTPCPGWSVLDLSAHLAGVDLSFLARHRDAHAGPGAPAGSERDFIRWLDAFQDTWVQAARRLSPRLAADLLAWSGPQVADTLGAQDPAASTASVSWAGSGPVANWLDQARELSEQWIHRQQLLQALGRPSDLRADLAGPVLDGLRFAYRHRLGPVPGSPGDTATIAVAGPVTRTWHLVAGPSGAHGPQGAASAGWAFRDQAGRREVARLSLSTEQAWRLLTNNLPAGQRDGLDAGGDPAVLEVLLRTRAIVGNPQ